MRVLEVPICVPYPSHTDVSSCNIVPATYTRTARNVADALRRSFEISSMLYARGPAHVKCRTSKFTHDFP